MRDLLDIHPALGTGDHRHLSAGPVDKKGEVIFLRNINTIGDVEPVDLLALLARLGGHQRVAEHRARVALDVLDAMGQPHATLRVDLKFLKLSLAASAGVDLRLHHVERAGQLLRGLDRLLHAHRRMAFGHRDAMIGEELLGLVFVDVHGAGGLL